MATILIKNYKVTVDGKTMSGPLMVGPLGVAVGEKTGAKWRGIQRINTFEQRYWICRWDDVVGYEIDTPRANQFAGSTINAHQVILTLKTTTNQHSFRLNYTDPHRVRNLLGPYLAQVDARRAA